MDNVRNLVVGGVSLVKCKVRGFGSTVLNVRNMLEPELQKNGYLIGAPFRTVSLILRFTNCDNPNPEIGEIEVHRSLLPVAVELDAKHLETLNSQELEHRFKLVMIDVLCDIAANFDLPYKFLDEMRNK